MKRILVPVDFSFESELALKWAVRLAKEDPISTLYLLHVVPYPAIVPQTAFVDVDEMIARDWEEARKRLEELRRTIPPPLHSVVLRAKGNLLTEIQSVCEAESVDILVIATHGRRGLSRLLHPNFTEEVVRTLACPVLVLHANDRTLAEADAEVPAAVSLG
ncbi:MAG: universal stress protein [Elusimicrobia bacterium]|nr:universal stress protein [Elusimicrobiota bacterium]